VPCFDLCLTITFCHINYYRNYQNMAEDHTYKGVGECHPYREFEGMQPCTKRPTGGLWIRGRLVARLMHTCLV
jgi:hypothetical protein